MELEMNVYQSGLQTSAGANILKRRVPKPQYRHAAPAGPWPYIDDLADQDSEEVIDAKNVPIIGSCGHNDCEDCKNWFAYPQSLFGNWTIKPVRKCGIERAVRKEHDCTIHTVDVMNDGVFRDSGTFCVTARNKREYWRETLVPERKDGIRVRAMFLDKMSGPVLQMLGTKYTVEPFFFSSSLNWIPSRFQENPIPKIGDHITVTLTFLRCVEKDIAQGPSNRSVSESAKSVSGSPWSITNQFVEVDHIDTHAPLLLHSVNKVLLLDFLAIHMIRNINGSTTLSFHHDMDGSTTAEEMFSRLKLVGRSVYWQIIVRKSKDPTFVFLGILWSALYAWDQALEALYDHFCKLESRVITTNNVALTYELHVIRAHLLHYTSLLRDFEESVKFIRDTHNPAMDHESITDDERKDDKALLDRECQHLLTEIKRLQMNRQMQDDRVENVKHLVYAIVNIEDSRAMKRLSYITMIFLPASFMAAIFGMNVMELNPGTLGTLPHYAEASVPLTFATIWIIVAYQNRFVLRDNQAIWKKLLWPAALVHGLTAPRDSSPV